VAGILLVLALFLIAEAYKAVRKMMAA